MKDINMSPLMYYTQKQAEKVSNSKSNEDLMVDFAMRYGNPSIKSKIKKLHDNGCENLIILPLYPQYAAATTATVCDEVYRTLMKMRWQPSLKLYPHYESDPLYIDALVNSINSKIEKINWKPDLILASYHGIPKNILIKEIHIIVIVTKPQDLFLKSLMKLKLKLLFNQGLDLKNGCNLILIKL